jgi:FixJ family two-component response regulator
MGPMGEKLVIVVDDDANVLRAFKRVLQVHGYAVQAYSSVNDFFKNADCSCASCLILDIHLSGASGIELRMLVAEKGIVVPTIFMTADDSELLCDEANAAGCIAYLRKPISADALISAIDNARSTITVGLSD